MASIFQPGQATLRECTISSIPFVDGNGKNYFHVQELRIYEDHCKAYFTAQLVIEADQNTWEGYLNPGAPVSISFEAPRSDGGPTKTYTENFKVYSYESKPKPRDNNNAMIITLSLMGDEYYRDRYNSVSQAFSNIPGTQAAQAIHEQYMSVNGSLSVQPSSLGMIGLERVPHEVNNKKPIKAIHDILDKVVYAAYPSCAAMYFRNKPGYVMSPLQYLLENASIDQTFIHQPSQGAFLNVTATGYDRINHLRPMAPPGEDRGMASASDVDGIFKSMSFFDIKSGNFAENGDFSSLSQLSAMAQQFKGAVMGKLGGRRIFSVLDDLHQARSVAKNGPAGYQKNEDAFLTALTYAPKFWVSVPMQTGLNVTCGTRINVFYPFSNLGVIGKTLYVARLIHELRFTEGTDGRNKVTVNGLTDIFGVDWGN